MLLKGTMQLKIDFFFYFFGVLKENEEIPNSALANPISF